MSGPVKSLVLVALLLAVLMSAAAGKSVLARASSPPVALSEQEMAPDAPMPLNHFYCYRVVSGLPVNVTIRTQDQFDKRPRRTVVGDVNRFCNPVKKTFGTLVSDILFPNDHLMLYNIGTHKDTVAHEVQVKNQFGTQFLAVYAPAEVLMVPTRKKPHDPPKDTDHFKCYYVKGQTMNLTVSLEDQFQQTQTVVLQPASLCNPTRKYHNGVWTEIKHPRAHLVCYFVVPKDFTKKVVASNQFRREKITTVLADQLCVPSKKKVIQ